MVITPALALWIALLVGAVVVVAEVVHHRRIGRIAHLAFGPNGRASAWTALASPARVAAATAATWGLLVLLSADPRVKEEAPAREAAANEGSTSRAGYGLKPAHDGDRAKSKSWSDRSAQANRAQ